jgi:hypothetical protein
MTALGEASLNRKVNHTAHHPTLSCHCEKGKSPDAAIQRNGRKPTCFYIVISRRPEWGDAAIQRTLGQPDASQQTGLPRPNGLAITAWSEKILTGSPRHFVTRNDKSVGIATLCTGSQ